MLAGVVPGAQAVAGNAICALDDAEAPGHWAADGRRRCLHRIPNRIFDRAPVHRLRPVGADRAPAMNGFDMVRNLQAHDATVNVLFISSQPTNGLAADGLLDQFPLLKKPFEAIELVQAAAAALARGQAPGGGSITPLLDKKKEESP